MKQQTFEAFRSSSVQSTNDGLKPSVLFLFFDKDLSLIPLHCIAQYAFQTVMMSETMALVSQRQFDTSQHRRNKIINE